MKLGDRVRASGRYSFDPCEGVVVSIFEYGVGVSVDHAVWKEGDGGYTGTKTWPYFQKELTLVSAPTPTLHTHASGALRESKEGKGRPDLFLAGFPRAITALTKHVDCELGRERNWEKGLPESSLICSAFRHLLGYTSGVSEDTPEYNLVAAAWNVMVLLEEYLRVQDEKMPWELLDVVKEKT